MNQYTSKQKFLINEKCTSYTDEELHEIYDDMLDDVYGVVKIAGYEYHTSYALKEIDPTAYRCGFSDWLDGEPYEEIDDKYYQTDEIEEMLNEEELD